MLFTRTIRRKLLLGLALVMSMLVTASVSGIWGLASYRNTIRELQYSIDQAPQQAKLVSAVNALFGPLSVTAEPKTSAIRQRQLQDKLAAAREAYANFHRNLDRMPATEVHNSQLPLTLDLLNRVDLNLTELEEATETLLEHGLFSQEEQVDLVIAVARLAEIVQKIPDPAKRLRGTLTRARSDYRSTVTLVRTTGTIAVVLFLGLIRYGYVCVFDPIRKLHEGARRVAQGDFDFRIEIPRNDEMGELAESFNQMTARFQDIAHDLDRQVCERSQQLVRSERLAGVGFLSAGVAHEINNPLSAIAMAAESLEGRLSELLHSDHRTDVEVVRQYLQMIQRESFRCQQITAKLLNFARSSDASRKSTDITELIGEVISMIQHLSKYQEMHIDFARTQPCSLEINTSEIKQVVLNLVANALESMEPGGKLTIDIVEQTDQVEIRFSDGGCGMTAEVIENLFDPFFTRRRVGQGTGLGLSISHRIISQHGGTIQAKSDGPGCGSTFCVRLPRKAVVTLTAA